ncbi:Histidine decarboxylase [Geodia barretti]|nr:Histidine decarboxylase [Geodia barretti]
MYGLYLARELHPEGMLYFSEEAHYSILKIARVLNMPHTTVKRRADGEIDYDDLRDMLTVHRGRPAIILATIGTTMRGAVDDIPAILQIIDDLNIGENYIHADAALSGMILPYVDDPQPFGFDAGIDSISISGHKLIGAPLPCGIVLTRKHLVETLGRAVELVGVNDTTLSGSRNGLTPLMLWYAINRYGAHEWRETVGGMLDTAEYAVNRFNEHGINAWRHRNSPTVVFDRPSQEVFDRWQIAPEGDVAHIITMPPRGLPHHRPIGRGLHQPAFRTAAGTRSPASGNCPSASRAGDGARSRNNDAAHRDHGGKPHRDRCPDCRHSGRGRSEPQQHRDRE